MSSKTSDIGKCLRSGAGCSPDRHRCLLSIVYPCEFYPSVFVGSSSAESMSTVPHLGRMENDVNLYFLPNPFCFCPIYCYISLLLIVWVCAYSKMDSGLKTSGRVFFDAAQIQPSTSLCSQFTALQRAHVVIAVFRPKPAGVF